ncbi:hypothetical protein EDC04DRAFT_3095525 [Pisolithus marmoratus]|nr:hypothetical protein EDC04DRAFT_3095525 [Pisolithus marmoratus]
MEAFLKEWKEASGNVLDSFPSPSVACQTTEDTYRTQDQVRALGNAVLPVHLAAAGAQQMLPALKKTGSTDIGGHWLLELQNAELSWCHTYGHHAIVWNFYDLDNHLDSKEFQYLMMSMVGELDAPVRTLPTAATPSHIATCLPYQKFVAYIVDLTHVLEMLFPLTADERGKKLTRRAIKLAFKAYYESSWMRDVHEDIGQFDSRLGVQDLILEIGRCGDQSAFVRWSSTGASLRETQEE